MMSLAVSLLLSFVGHGDAAEPDSGRYRSHPPLRKAPPPARRALAEGPRRFVDPRKGDDSSAGTEAAPWRTLRHAIEELRPGDTLYLRGGTYYEAVQVRLVGREGAPITVASYPGEQAVIDGGLREFFESPADCWTPFPEGRPDEYRSTRRYPNLRQVVGSFGDSMVGLHTYYHAKDLRAANEAVESDKAAGDVKPLYCGPGVWYDREDGTIHCRLAHTHLKGFVNYEGETDPRKLPLVIAPFRAVPLHLDGARHLRLQDLVIRGGGYDTVVIDQSSDIEFDNVTVWCGTFGLRAAGLQRFRFFRSALYGSAPPWSSRFEAGFNTYPGRTTRNISRLHTHSLLIAQGNDEFEVYAFPFNDDWEISYSEFTDSGADGLYLGCVNMRFHHNVVENMTDDGLYLSPMYPRHSRLRGKSTLHLYQNFFGHCLTLLAYGGTERDTDTIYFYRNIVDMRKPVRTGRGFPKPPEPGSYMGKVTGDHGSPPWPSMRVYQNTFYINSSLAKTAESWLTARAAEDRPRWLLNNILIHGTGLFGHRLSDSPHARIDGNLYWAPGLKPDRAAAFFSAYRASPAYEKSKKVYPPGFDTNSLVADPLLHRADLDWRVENDYRLRAGSPALDSGTELPGDWPDPLKELDKGPPDIGALPLGAPAFRAGRAAAPSEP